MTTKHRRTLLAAAGLALFALSFSAAAITESQCRRAGGTPNYVENVVTADECGFLSDFFGFCEVGSTERRYTGCSL